MMFESSVFCLLRLPRKQQNNFLTPFFVVGSLFSFSFQIIMSKRKKRKHMGEILGWWKEILDVFGRMILVRHLRRQKYPLDRKKIPYSSST